MADDSTQTRTLALPAIIDLDSLDTVRDGLLDAVDAGPLSIDGSGVERVSTNALLMLISAAETSRRNSFDFRISGASAPMLGAIDRLGLGPSFSALMKG